MATRSPDVLLVGLGSTLGLRSAEDALRDSIERAGASVVLVRAVPVPQTRTLMATDLRWARAARRATLSALAEHPHPGAVLYNTTTAALLWPRPGAVRFDAPARVNRPGRHGLWQRPLERRRLRSAPLLIPQSAGALAEAGDPATPSVVVPVAVEPSGRAAETRDIAAITYAAHPEKKGLAAVLEAFAHARREGELLVVAGLDRSPSGDTPDGVEFAGRLAPDEYRALLGRSKVYVTAPVREDYGIGQLEALADGCRVVTTPAPGPYVALPLLEAGLGWVVPEHGLRAALRSALDDNDPGYTQRALAAIAPFRQAAVDQTVATELLPALIR